jgi:hypothetical protein
MPKRSLEQPFDKRAAFRSIIDKFPFDDEGKDRYCEFIMLLDGI